MKKTLAIAAIALVLPLGCSSSSSDSGAGGAAATMVTGGAGDTTAAGTTASGAGSSAAGASAGASGGTSDKCPGGVAKDDFVIVTTAAQLEELASCTTFKSLNVSGKDITNLNALSNVTTVTGLLYIQDTKVTDLRGLSKLTSVGGDLAVGLSVGMEKQMSSAITSLTGLENLKTIGGQLQINENASLTDISALNSLTSIGSGKLLQFRNNSSVVTCDAQKLAKQLKRDTDKSGMTEICGTKSDTCGQPAACPPVT
jgi:hypothetical protein